MKTLSRFILLYILCSLCTIQAMHNNNNSDQDKVPAGKISAVEKRLVEHTTTFMRESRALLHQDDRARALETFEYSPRAAHQEKGLQRSSTEILCTNAKTIAAEARKKRATIIDYSSKQLDIKIKLLTAEKQIERQIELLKTVKEENKEVEKEQLRTYMTQAFIAIEAANTPQEDIDLTHATLASTDTATEENRRMLEDFAEEEDVNALLAQTDKILARAEASLARNRQELTLSPRAQKLKVLMEEVEHKAQERPDASYEILLEYIQTHKELFLSKMQGENNAGLHVGIQRMAVHNKHPLDYILFTVMLECGVDRTLAYNGKTLLEAAMDSGNQMLVQLLTTERPTKQTLVDLAYEHYRDDLIPFLLSEEECIARACQYKDDSMNNNNNNNF